MWIQAQVLAYHQIRTIEEVEIKELELKVLAHATI